MSDIGEARAQEARAALLRALERLDDAAAEGGAYVDAIVVAFGVRLPDAQDDDGSPLVAERVGWESNAIPSYQAAGLLRQVAARLEGGRS